MSGNIWIVAEEPFGDEPHAPAGQQYIILTVNYEKTVAFIKHVEERPILWDTRRPDHWNLQEVDKNWDEIALLMRVRRHVLLRSWRQLIYRLDQACSQVPPHVGPEDFEKVIQYTFTYYKQMLFMRAVHRSWFERVKNYVSGQQPELIICNATTTHPIVLPVEGAEQGIDTPANPAPRQPQVVRQIEPQPQAQREHQPRDQPELQPHAQPDPQPQDQPELQPEAEPEPQPEAEPEPQPEAEPEPQPQAKPEPQAQAKPEPQPQAQPELQPPRQAENQCEVNNRKRKCDIMIRDCDRKMQKMNEKLVRLENSENKKIQKIVKELSKLENTVLQEYDSENKKIQKIEKELSKLENTVLQEHDSENKKIQKIVKELSKLQNTVLQEHDSENKKIQKIEKELSKLQNTVLQDQGNEDMIFYRSILPYVSKIPAEKKLQYRKRILEVVEEFSHQSESSDEEEDESRPNSPIVVFHDESSSDSTAPAQ